MFQKLKIYNIRACLMDLYNNNDFFFDEDDDFVHYSYLILVLFFLKILSDISDEMYNLDELNDHQKPEKLFFMPKYSRWESIFNEKTNLFRHIRTAMLLIADKNKDKEKNILDIQIDVYELSRLKEYIHAKKLRLCVNKINELNKEPIKSTYHIFKQCLIRCAVNLRCKKEGYIEWDSWENFETDFYDESDLEQGYFIIMSWIEDSLPLK